MSGSVDWTVCGPLYASGVLWTLFYDTIYALQDRACDVKAGVRSSAVALGDNVKPFLAAVGACQIGLLTLAGIMNHHSLFYTAGVAGAGLHMAWIVWALRINDVANAGLMFRRSVTTGVILLGGILLDLIFKRNKKKV